MQLHWILDVLSDMKGFASRNGLHALAEHLDDTLLIAAGEIRRAGAGDMDFPATQQHPDDGDPS